MKKFVLVITIMLSLISVSAYASKEAIVESKEVSEIINECYPNLKDYYEAGVLSIESLTRQTLADGSTEYDMRYRFVNNYYSQDEVDQVLKDQYPDIYMMKKSGFLKDVNIYRFVDKATGKILNYVAYNRNIPDRTRHLGLFGRREQ